MSQKTNVVIYLDGIEESVGHFTLADFGGVLPAVGDYVSLPIEPATKDNEEPDTDAFRVTARHSFPQDKSWSLDVEPVSSAGYDYQRKLQKQFARKL